jgi:hypothetical protein
MNIIKLGNSVNENGNEVISKITGDCPQCLKVTIIEKFEEDDADEFTIFIPHERIVFRNDSFIIFRILDGDNARKLSVLPEGIRLLDDTPFEILDLSNDDPKMKDHCEKIIKKL